MMKPGVYNSYVWQKLMPGMMEYGDSRQGTTNPAEVYTDIAAQKRQYLIAERGANLGADIVWKELPRNTVEEQAAFKDQLLRLVPGDIWVKDNDDGPTVNNPTGKERNNHISVVASVPPNAASMSIDDIMNAIILIEGGMVSQIQSVIKKLSVGDYDNNNLTSKKTIYPGYSIVANQDGFSLNCQSWAIRRLK